MTNRNRAKKITIIGIGNTLYSDEGIGVYLLPILQEEFKDDKDIEIIEGLTDGLKLLAPIEDTDNLIIVDSIDAGKEGGEIILIEGDDVPNYYGIRQTVHQMGFQEVLLAAKFQERYPERIAMFGMQPTSLTFAEELTETNRAKLPNLAKAVIDKVNSWRSED